MSIEKEKLIAMQQEDPFTSALRTAVEDGVDKCSDEADIKAGMISIESPVARQLLKKKEGDSVTVRVPKGEIEYEILSVKYE
jgi:hypothetical protein